MQNTDIVRPLAAADLARLARLLGMIGSRFDAEALNAARLADRFVRARGLQWADVLGWPTLAPPASDDPPSPREPDPPDWQATVAACRASRVPNAWERTFLAELATYRRPPSGRQAEILASIAAKVAAAP